MIHEIFVLLRDALKAKGVPFEVVYGPTQVAPKVGASRVQMLRDYDAGDQVLAARSDHKNPRMMAVRAMGALVRIYAHSTLDGAQRHDHERIADLLVDQVHVELHKIVRHARTLWRVQRAGFIADATTDGWAGVVYELRFQIDRGVFDTSWVGAAAAEATMGGSGAGIATGMQGSGPDLGRQLPNATTRAG